MSLVDIFKGMVKKFQNADVFIVQSFTCKNTTNASKLHTWFFTVYRKVSVCCNICVQRIHFNPHP